MDSSITISTIKDEKEIEILRNKTSKYQDFIIKYDDDTLDLLKKNISRDKSLYLIAKQDEKFAAFCSTDTDWWEDSYFFLREIFVEPDFQGKGVGRELILMSINHAKTNGAIGIVTETAFENVPMQKLCEKLGFKKWDNPGWKEGITYKILF